MLTHTTDDEARRTSPLAFWRYAHDYLRAAHTLDRQHRIPCAESQVGYYAAAQGIEFALKAYLRANGATVADLRAEIGHSLAKALDRCEALGLPDIPLQWRAAVAEIAQCHQETRFVFVVAPDTAFPALDPLIGAGVFVLDRIAPDVARHFVAHLGGDSTPTVETFVRRLRADLSATFEAAAKSGDADATSLSLFPDEAAPGSPGSTSRLFA
jgi:hypothetical protein